MLSRSLALLAFAPSALSKRVRIVSYNIHAWRDAEHDDNLERLSELLAGLFLASQFRLDAHRLDLLFPMSRGSTLVVFHLAN